MDDVDLQAKADGKGWWEEPDPKTAHEKYLKMHGSETNRSKLAITERLMKRVDWTGKSVLEYGCGGGYFTVWMAKQGARVTAIEMSPCAIGAVNYYAAQEGVADRVRVVPGNAETDTVDGRIRLHLREGPRRASGGRWPLLPPARPAAQARRRHLHRDPERSLAQLPAGRHLRARVPSATRAGAGGTGLTSASTMRPCSPRACGRWASRRSAGGRAISSRGASSANGSQARRGPGRDGSISTARPAPLCRSRGWGGRSWSSEEKPPSRRLRRAHLLRWRPRPHAQRRETTPRVRPSGAASHLDPQPPATLQRPFSNSSATLQQLLPAS